MALELNGMERNASHHIMISLNLVVGMMINQNGAVRQCASNRSVSLHNAFNIVIDNDKFVQHENALCKNNQSRKIFNNQSTLKSLGVNNYYVL